MAKKNTAPVSLKNTQPADTALATAANSSGMGKMTTADITKAAEGAIVLPQVVALKEVGDYIRGLCEGPGSPTEFKDASGDQKALPTFVFRYANGVRVKLLSSYQLDKDLPDLAGHEVTVVKGETKAVGMKRVNQFIVIDHGKPGDKA